MWKWVDSKGKEHKPEYMSDAYLINCIRYVKKKINQEEDYLPPPSYYSLLNEYKRRQDIANGSSK